MVLPTILNRTIHYRRNLVLLFVVVLFSLILDSQSQINFPSPSLVETWNLNAREENLDEDFLIDHRFPTVISNEYGQGQGHESSHFGITVNLLRHSRQDHTWILIGEPKANFTQALNEPGVIWKCGLFFNSPTINFGENSNGRGRDYCEILEIKDVVDGPQRYGQKWLGVSMGILEPTNADPQLLTCAHRKRLGNTDKMNGACYVINPGQLQTILRSTTNVIQVTQASRITHANYSGIEYSAFGMGLNVNGNKIVFGAPGLDSIAMMDADSNGIRADWKLHLSQFTAVSSNSYYGYAVTSGNYYPNGRNVVNENIRYFAVGCPRIKGKGLVSVERTHTIQSSSRNMVEEIQGFHLGSYFGSVLYTQDIDEDGIDELFVGAPNTGYLNPDFFTEQIHPYLREKEMMMSTSTSIFFSSSSSPSSSSSGKINSGNGNEGDVGCVYVYQYQANRMGHSRGSLQVVQILLGNKEPFSRFGSAISSISIPSQRQGRIQFFHGAQAKSTKNYIVIGAPYENGNEGAVYFYDTTTLVKWRKYSKKIAASQLRNSVPLKAFSGFGFSFSNQVDVDGNGTPDLAIGSYLTKEVVLLRTRHEIELRHKMTILIPSGRGQSQSQWREEFPSNYLFKKDDTEFQLKVYLECSLPLKIRENNANLQFWSRIQVDVSEIDERYSVSIQDSKSPFKQIDSQTIEFSSFLSSGKHPVNPQKMQTSGNEILEFTTNFRVSRIKAFEDNEFPPGLKITLKSWYNETQSLLASRTEYKIISNAKGFGPTVEKSQANQNRNRNEPTSTDTNNEDKFQPYLPSPAFAKDVSATVNILPNECQQQFACKPNLKISGAHFTTLYGQQLEGDGSSFTIGSLPEIILRWTITNENQGTESAITPGAFIKFSLGSISNTSRKVNKTKENWSWSLLSTEDSNRCEQLLLNDSRSQFGFRCNSSGILQPKQLKMMQIRLNMSGLYPERVEQMLEVELIPTHAHQFVVDTNASVGHLKIQANAQVTVEGNQILRKISMENKDFKQLYTITLTGESPVNSISFNFSVPVGRTPDAKNIILVSQPEVFLSLLDESFPLECNTTVPFSRFETQANVLNEEFPSSNPHPTVVDAMPNKNQNSPFDAVSDTRNDLQGNQISRLKRNVKNIMLNSNSSSQSAVKTNNTHSKSGNAALETKVEKNYLESIRNQTIELSCANPSNKNRNMNPNPGMRCIFIQCQLPKVNKGAQFQVAFPMELSKYGHDLLTSSKGMKAIHIKSSGTAQILQGEIPKLHFDTDMTSVIVELSLSVKNDKIPAWIYLVSGVGGFVALAIFSFILYSCGFFKRDMKVQLDQMKTQNRDTLCMTDQEQESMNQKLVENENQETENTGLLQRAS